ncbi:hypothetical protein LOAG_02962 [Loa loa]|uniref:Uncharacterized protein n=1 Tax=Loa loa TaxID=7209 RepID=A0A1S0U7B8_LOALO|nr:hypothetical protein LOAG_02962 [Loa loa]EFO25525.1 hypothetical protein LOAG_02962 [Loa loa]
MDPKIEMTPSDVHRLLLTLGAEWKDCLRRRWCGGDDWESSVEHCRNVQQGSEASLTRSLQFIIL